MLGWKFPEPTVPAARQAEENLSSMLRVFGIAFTHRERLPELSNGFTLWSYISAQLRSPTGPRVGDGAALAGKGVPWPISPSTRRCGNPSGICAGCTAPQATSAVTPPPSKER